MSKAARFASAYAVLTASHEFADHWVQLDSQAVAKGQPGPAGVRACAAHVATYTATQGVALLLANKSFDLKLNSRWAVAALAVSAITHYVADRQGGHWRDEHPRGIVRLAAATGKKQWLQRDPMAGYFMDQSWHKACIAVAAAIAAGGTE
jgi:hypothetical protein